MFPTSVPEQTTEREVVRCFHAIKPIRDQRQIKLAMAFSSDNDYTTKATPTCICLRIRLRNGRGFGVPIDGGYRTGSGYSMLVSTSSFRGSRLQQTTRNIFVLERGVVSWWWWLEREKASRLRISRPQENHLQQGSNSTGRKNHTKISGNLEKFA